MRKCPFCDGDIEESVRKCKHCGEWVTEENKSSHIIKTHSAAKNNENNKDEFIAMRQSHAKLQHMLAMKLGKGYWGIEKRDNYIPTHEEIVFLFSKIHLSLGFETIKIVRTEYPDCEAIKDGNTVAIEFEPKLSAFDHINDIEQCNCIICWEDDLKDFDSLKKQIREHNIDIIELKEIWEQFKTKETLPKSIEWTEKDFRKLSELQLKILSPFIIKEKDVMTKEEIQQISKESGKSTGGALAGLLTSTNKRCPILRELAHKYSLDSRCRSLLTKVLKESKII